MRKQLARLSDLMTGRAERGSLTIYRTESSNGGKLKVKIAAWLPKPVPVPGVATLDVQTNAESMLASDSAWRIDPAAIRGVLAADARRRSSLQANLRVARVSGAKADGIERALKALSHRTQQRLTNACRTYAAHVAAYATARGAHEVRYDDSTRPTLTHFPWDLLRTRIAQKLDALGIAFIHVGHVGRDSSERSATGADGENAA
jgi:hypothetical protein